ncbi:MAG: DinB family protein [Bacteroidota bacterium]
MPKPDPGLASDDRLRAELVALLRGSNAHVDAATTLGGLPFGRANERPDGHPHSLWDLVYHLWFTQHDILDFCRNLDYAHRAWPDAYWPDAEATRETWTDTQRAFFDDLGALIALAEEGDLLAEFGHAPGYTLLRELLLAADHNAHHLGQIILVRRALGLWG